MIAKLNTAPSVEPLSLLETKYHLRLDSESFADDISEHQSIAPGLHNIAAAYGLEGTGVDILGYDALVILNAGACGSGGTVNVKIQESDDNSTYTDWTGGAFTQVTEANDNAVQEKAYTGTKEYIRVVCTVGTAACSFAVTVLKDKATGADDTYISSLITAAREYTEELLSRRFITQTWEFYHDEFPGTDELLLPYPPLQSVTSVIYTDCNGDATEFSSDDYDVDTVSQPGRIVLGYGKSWPTATLRPMNPIKVTMVCGYGAAGSSVPEPIRQFIRIFIAEMYEQREESITGTIVNKLGWANVLLTNYRIWRSL